MVMDGGGGERRGRCRCCVCLGQRVVFSVQFRKGAVLANAKALRRLNLRPSPTSSRALSSSVMPPSLPLALEPLLLARIQNLVVISSPMRSIVLSDTFDDKAMATLRVQRLSILHYPHALAHLVLCP